MKELYKRFGLKLNLQEAQWILRRKLKNILIHGELGEKIFDDDKTGIDIVWLVSNELGLEYSSEYYYDKKYANLLGGASNFEEYIIRLQTIIDILWDYEKTRSLALSLSNFVSESLETSPMDLGLKVMQYKTKSPQIILITSKKLEKEIIDTLGLLESNKRFKPVLSCFETGLKEFFSSKTQEAYKDAIEDMYTACDELVKAVLNNKNKGFKHIQGKEESQKLGLNGYQKELYKNLRNWMDEIKHGTRKEFDRNDTEMIISMVGSLIRYIISKYE